MGTPPRSLNQSFASPIVLRMKSYALPWKRLVPERVIMLTTDAPEKPYSALKFDCCSLYSSTASGEGRYVTWVIPPFGSKLVALAPSNRTSAPDVRLPLITKFVPVQPCTSEH